MHRLTGLCKAWCLSGSCSEMPVSLSTTSTFQQDNFLSMFGHITDILSCFSIVYYCSTRHFNYFVYTVLTKTLVFTAGFSMSSHRMTVILQMEQRPVVTVTSQNNMASSSAIAPIRTTVRNIFLAPHVRRASSALT